ncbi:DEAD/DEAH box helicase [Vibrio sp. PNB22_3_1]
MKQWISGLLGKMARPFSPKDEFEVVWMQPEARQPQLPVVELISRPQEAHRKALLAAILDYWKSADLMQVPELPRQVRSGDQGDFVACVGALKAGEVVQVHFQSHVGDYLYTDPQGEISSPNIRPPATFLLSIECEISGDGVSMLVDPQALVSEFNRAVTSVLYRRVDGVGRDLSESKYCEQIHRELVDNVFSAFHLSKDDEPVTMPVGEFYCVADELNKEIAKLWVIGPVAEFMAIHSSATDLTSVNHSRDDLFSYDWSYSVSKERSSSCDLVFFADDIESIRLELDSGADIDEIISKPLIRYLFADQHRSYVPDVAFGSEVLSQRTASLLRGRWPSNNQYGLSLLQYSAAKEILSGYDLVSVNGPPGTGKTTLLKDVISELFIQRTLDMMMFHDQVLEGDLPEQLLSGVLEHSMLVVSSNNKAVENISLELPLLAGVDAALQNEISFFRECVGSGSWGLFSAALGNQSNRKAFCSSYLSPLSRALKGHSDPFDLYSVSDQLSVLNKEISALELIDSDDQSQRFSLEQDRLQIFSAWYDQYGGEHAYFCHVLNGSLPSSVSASSAVTYVHELVVRHSRSDEILDASVQWELLVNGLNKVAGALYRQRVNDAEKRRTLSQARQQFLALHDEFRRLKPILESQSAIVDGDHVHSRRIEGGEPVDGDRRVKLLLSSPFGAKDMNQLRSRLFVASLAYNEALIRHSARSILPRLEALEDFILKPRLVEVSVKEASELWSVLFLVTPVISSSLASIANQFQYLPRASIGQLMFDESGQIMVHHAVGALNKAKRVVFVGDPKQLEPIHPFSSSLDEALRVQIAREHQIAPSLLLPYKVCSSSAQVMADNASTAFGRFGDLQVGHPLLVHRRCREPMFSIVNAMSYESLMVRATGEHKSYSRWVDVEPKAPTQVLKYENQQELEAAFSVIGQLYKDDPAIFEDGLYLLSPFADMADLMSREWSKRVTLPEIQAAMGGSGYKSSDVAGFVKSNIGTVHTFQGGEAGCVILCLAANEIYSASGVDWLNQSANLLNVAVSRAKHHLVVIGHRSSWESGRYSRFLCESLF